jgi:hypothetical protein
MNNTKLAFSTLDDELANLLMEACQISLNNTKNAKTISREMNITIEQAEVLARVAIELSSQPEVGCIVPLEVRTMKELNDMSSHLHVLKSGIK